MKKIINGKRYDTSTADEVASASGGESRSDFKWFAESIYRTQRGNWFLCGEGGPPSRYARQVGSGYSGGAGIIPLDETEARDWLERYGRDQDLEDYFPGVIEDA